MSAKKRVLFGMSGLVVACLACAGGWYWYGVSAAKTVPEATDTARAESDVTLDQEQREYIWQIEHHVLVLGKQWFSELGSAWAKADAAAMTDMLAPGFQGQLPRRPDREELGTPFARVTRLKDSGGDPLPVDRAGFVNHLLDLRKMFSGQPSVKVFAKTLVPEERDKLDGSWSGVGVGRMWGETSPGKPGEVVVQFKFRTPRPAVARQPGWLQQARIMQSQVSRSERFLLRDVTRQRGIDPDIFYDAWKHEHRVSATGGVYVCDFNRDGILDFLLMEPEGIHLYRGLPGGKFKDVTRDMGLPALPAFDRALYAAFADIDGDGWEDLIMLGRVYRNEEGAFFKDCTQLCNLRPDPRALGVVLGDFDRDGKVDLYFIVSGVGKASSWLEGKSGRESGNQLWRNLGNWQFQDVTAASNTGGGSRSVFSAVWLDADDDGWPDLYVPNEFGHGVLLVNQRDATFRERTIGNLPGDFGTMGITCGDVNNDGKIDIYLANMYSKTGARVIGNLKPDSYANDVMAKMRRFVSGSQLYLNRGNLDFEPVGQAWQLNDVGWAYGPALVDLDNDGFLDVFATSGFMSFDRSEPDG